MGLSDLERQLSIHKIAAIGILTTSPLYTAAANGMDMATASDVVWRSVRSMDYYVFNGSQPASLQVSKAGTLWRAQWETRSEDDGMM